MGTEEIIALSVIALIIVGAVVYIIKAKKKGVKCIGCNGCSSCPSKCGCNGCCNTSQEENKEE